MNKWNKIASIALLIPFLFSAIGLLVFNSECTCTGSEHYSLYVAPNTCGSNTDAEPILSCCGDKMEVPTNNHSCDGPNSSCGCSDFEVEYLKISNQFVNEEIRIAKIQELTIFISALIFHDNLVKEQQNINPGYFYIDPPNVNTSIQFLIEINQLKIPLVA